MATQPSGILDRPVSIPPANRTLVRLMGGAAAFVFANSRHPQPRPHPDSEELSGAYAPPPRSGDAVACVSETLLTPHTTPSASRQRRGCPALMRRPRGAATSVACVSANVLRESNRARPYSRPTQPGAIAHPRYNPLNPAFLPFCSLLRVVDGLWTGIRILWPVKKCGFWKLRMIIKRPH